MDLRTQKIYDALILAFQQLLEEKAFEEITVNELCERARTRRATFYKHFSDKYDFFQYMLKQMRENLFKEIRNEPNLDDLSKLLHMLIDSGLTFVEQNRKFLLSVENSSVARAMLLTITNESFDSDQFPDLFQDELEAQFLIGALNQCVRWWMHHMNKISKTDMQKRIYELADNYMKSAR